MTELIVGSSQTITGYTHFVRVTIDNPVPGGGVPAVDYSDLFRREPGGEWMRIATALTDDAVFDDHGVASGRAYEYFVRAYSSSGTYSDSAVSQPIGVNIAGAWLHDPDDPTGSEYNFAYDGGGRDVEREHHMELLHFSGRALPSGEFGEGENVTVSQALQLVTGDDDQDALEELWTLKKTLLYRNGRGDKVFVAMPSLPMSERRYGRDARLTLRGVDYVEAV